MSLKCGIIGLPNVGKSTLFNALTSSENAKAENYPFCTIEPNLGTVSVPDPRLYKIANLFQSKRVLPTFLEFVDIAGLVKGASQGEGLGNRFLSHIRETHSLLHVVRGFKDTKVDSVYKTVDIGRDIEVINLELLLADLEVAEKRLQKLEKAVRVTGDKTLKSEKEALNKAFESLKQEIPLRNVAWEKTESEWIERMNFITLKPILYILNQDEESFSKEEMGQSMEKLTGTKEEVIHLSCSLEAEISKLQDSEKQEFLNDMKLKEPALNKVIKAAYRQLNLITFFTAGEKETRAWTLTRGTLAPQAAGLIHSDFEKGFIKAEVYSYEQLFQYKTEKELTARGLVRLEGKNYTVQDGDVMHFRFQP